VHHIGLQEYVGTANDEVPLAVECATRLGVAHHVRMVSRVEFENDLEHLLECMISPQWTE